MRKYKITVNVEEIVDMNNNEIELKKCKDDLIYMIENYLYLIDYKDNELKPFKLVEKQKEVLKDIINNDKVIVNKHRQVGETTLEDAFIACSMYLHDKFDDKVLSVFLAAERTEMSNNRLRNIKRFIIQLLNSGLIRDINFTRLNDNCISLTNGCSVEYINLNSIYNIPRIKHSSIQWLFVDEAAFLTNESVRDFLIKEAKYLTNFKKFILTSTKNDLEDLFLPIYTCAREIGFKKIDISYKDVVGEGSIITEKRIDNMIGCLSREQFDCNFGDSIIGGLDLSKLIRYTGAVKYLLK